MVQLLQLVTLSVLSVSVAAQTPYPIVGVSVDPNSKSVPIRKNINAFANEGGPQWDLYLRAVAAMQSTSDADQLSWFQIAGIHGKPYIEWSKGGARNSNGWLGYCPHGEAIFLSWHRPYVVLYEQVLVATAQRIANEYQGNNKAVYQNAAKNLRSPFWDWATDSPAIPNAVVPDTVSVNFPNGNGLVKRTIANPLKTFNFPSAALQNKYGTWGDNKARMERCPGQSYPAAANALLVKRPNKRWVYDAFSKAQNFLDFASTGASGISIEQIHNGIHWDAACGGQFLASDFTAFDPLFMMHHTMVDRLWAYWQFAKPDQSMLTSSYSGGNRFSTPKGTIIGPDSPLQPFKNAQGQYHTTRSVNDIRNFGYTYTALEYRTKSVQQMQADAIAYINRVYGPAQVSSIKSVPSDGNMRIQKEQTRFFAALAVNVAEVPRPAIVEVYVGDLEVGSLVVMEHPMDGIVKGSFGLDDAVTKGNLQGLRDDVALERIQSGLKVSVKKADGTKVPLRTLPGLKISVETVAQTDTQFQDELPTMNTTSVDAIPLVEHLRLF